MQKDNLTKIVREIPSEHSVRPIEEITASTPMNRLGDEDDLFEFAMSFEETFQIEVDKQELGTKRTVGDVVTYLEGLIETD